MKILLISNGHGEDLNASLIGEKLRVLDSRIEIDAFPIVGIGESYIRRNIPIVSPVKKMPSGGFIYLNPINLFKDLSAGLILLTLKQLNALYGIRDNYDFVVSVGDTVSLLFAYMSGRGFVSFLVSYSSHYEGKLRLSPLDRFILNSCRCFQVFTRDKFTAEDLTRQGLKKVLYEGYPILDTISQKTNLKHPSKKMVALLPGSRLPEALDNLAIQLRVCEILVERYGAAWQFCGAIVPSITDGLLSELAERIKWEYTPGKLRKKGVEVGVYYELFGDIISQCDVAIGMAGTAVEQAVGMGKPVVQIPGNGPQFTYRFAEAQQRLLGLNVLTIKPYLSLEKRCEEAAEKISSIVNDEVFLKKCAENGKERIGEAGGSTRIAKRILALLNNS